MAIVQADNFSIYGTSTSLLLNGIYAQAGGITLPTDPDGISSGRVLSVNGTGASNIDGLRYVLNTNATTLGAAFRIWLPSLPTGSNGNVIPAIWRNAGNSPIASLTLTTTGRFEFRSGDYNGTILGTTVNPAITANGWYHVEGLLNLTAQTFELRVEGITVLNLTGLSLTGPVSQMFIGVRTTATSNSRPYQVKDLVYYDGAGSYNTSFLGSVLVTNLSPASDVALNWTPSTGTTGYTILDNIPPLDSQYIFAEDSPLPSPYVSTLTDLPTDVTSVKALLTYVRAAKADGGDGSLQVGIISDPLGTPATVLGADRPITVAQTYWRDVFEVDPKTSAPWLPTAVNAADLQINRTT